MENDRVLKTKDLIEVLGLGKTKTYQLLKQKIIPATQVGRQYLIMESELLKWLKSNIDKEIFI